jgi:hypothetical protein
MEFGNCRTCKHLGECYPTNGYVEEQLNANIRRDLCVNNDKVDWEQEDKSS